MTDDRAGWGVRSLPGPLDLFCPKCRALTGQPCHGIPLGVVHRPRLPILLDYPHPPESTPMEFDAEAKFAIMNILTNAGADLIGDLPPTHPNANPEYARAIYELTVRVMEAL